MSGGWESDPLFSAAEVVQDSADRMESIFRMFLHEESLLQSESPDPKLLNSIEYHRRDLATALGTTKWQLEDFERAVNLSALFDTSRTRGHTVARHKQFIRAISEQIVHVERGLEGPSNGLSEGNSQWINLNDSDRDGLALFLTGGNSIGAVAQCDPGNSIMRRFLDPTKTSEYDEKSDEIIELKTVENEDSHVNGIMHVSHSFDNSKENKLRKVGSNYFIRSGYETSIPIKDLLQDDNNGSRELENSDSNAKSFFSKSKLRGSRNRLYSLGHLGDIFSAYGSKVYRSFTKRLKDGEVTLESDQKPSSSYSEVSLSEQGRNSWLGSGSIISSGFCSNAFKSTMQSSRWFPVCRKAYQRFWYIIQLNRFPVQIGATIATLTGLGCDWRTILCLSCLLDASKPKNGMTYKLCNSCSYLTGSWMFWNSYFSCYATMRRLFAPEELEQIQCCLEFQCFQVGGNLYI